MHIRLSEIAKIEQLRSEVEAIQRAFRSLPRQGCNVEQLVNLKFQMQHWRQRLLNLVLKYLESRQVPRNPEARVAAYEILALLEIKPAPQDLSRIRRLVELETDSSVAAAARLFAIWGDHGLLALVRAQIEPSLAAELVKLAGPSRELPIFGNVPSRCTYERWSKMPDCAEYAFEGEGVHYRGIHFLPGDFLITNVNRDGNGVYTAVVEPRSYGYHMGVFAILQENGRRLPAVLETYKLGVRAVPLHSFVAPKFSSFVEVCRLKSPPEGFYARMNEKAAGMPSAIKGYCFDTEDPDRSYISCTTVATHLSELAGGPTIRAKSRYIQEPRVQKNLETFDLVQPAFLGMADYLIDERVESVGVIDNGQFQRNVTRELLERQFVRIFRNFELDLSLLPVMFALNRFGVRHMRAGTWLGKLIGVPYGLNKENLPKGPEKVLAVIEIYEHIIAAAVKKADARLALLWDSSKLIDIDALERDHEIESLLKSTLGPAQIGFRDPIAETASEAT